MFDPSGPSAVTLTQRQQAVLEVVQQYGAAHGYPPTVREIGALLGMSSSSTVHSHLAALERAGIVARDPSKPRALSWGPHASRFGVGAPPAAGAAASASVHGGTDVDEGIPLPLVGRVAAGAPMLADEHVEEVLHVPRRLVRSGSSFLLQVRGDSMTGAGILDGDWVVVRQQPTARDGEIVVALVGGAEEATCKRLVHRAGRIELHAENDAYEPIVPDDCAIAGIVTGVMRAF